MITLDKGLTYTIQQVSEMTGLSKQVIRKWEDRYGIIQPERLDNGYRIYNDNEVALLKKVVHFANKGYTIKLAAQYAQAELAEEEKEEKQANILPQQLSDQQTSEFDFYVKLLIEAGEVGDDAKILHLLQQAHNLYGIQTLLDNIVQPFMTKVGQLWCDKKWGEYQEAISSQTVRDFLTSLRRTIFVPNDAPLIVGGCLPEERHENPMHILLVKCMLHGYQTKMLGAAPAPTAIESTIIMTKPQIVLLSGTTNLVARDGGTSILALDEFAGTMPQTKFYIGGHGVIGLKDKLKLQHLMEVHSLDDILN